MQEHKGVQQNIGDVGKGFNSLKDYDDDKSNDDDKDYYIILCQH